MDIGAHCSVGDCHQQDFLPFTCDCCSRVFCLVHRSYDAHTCPSAGSKDRRVIECPVCNQLIKWTMEQDVNAVWEDHVRVGQCTPEKLYNQQATGGTATNNTTGEPKKKKKPRCAAERCREILLPSNKFSCTICRQDVCLKHRFASDHDCENAKKRLRQQWSYRSPFTTSTASTNTSSTRNAQQQRGSTSSVATSVMNGTKSAMTSLVQNAKAVAASASASINTNSEECPICQKKFAYVSQLIAHVNRAHPDTQQSQSSAAASASINSNSNASHRSSSPSVSTATAATGQEVCPQCRAVFSDLNALIQHAETAHTAQVAAASGRGAANGDDKCLLM